RHGDESHRAVRRVARGLRQVHVVFAETDAGHDDALLWQRGTLPRQTRGEVAVAKDGRAPAQRVCQVGSSAVQRPPVFGPAAERQMQSLPPGWAVKGSGGAEQVVAV